MKILLVASYPGISGATKSLIALANGINDSGNEAIVLIPKYGPIIDELERSKIRYFKIRFFNWVKPLEEELNLKNKVTWTLKKIINYINEYRVLLLLFKEKVDIIHINTLTAHWGAKSALLLKKKLIWHIREFLEEGILKEFRDLEYSLNLINKSDKVIAVSDSIKDHYKNDINNITRIYNGVPLIANSTIEKESAEAPLLKMVFVGRVVKGKGLEEIIEAMKIIIQKKENIQLDVYGEVAQNYLIELQNIIKLSSLEEVINFKGYKKNVNEFLPEYDITLVCSNIEAFGRVTVESMLNKTLVIGANTGGTAELIKDDVYGLLYEKGNHIDLANKIELVISKPDVFTTKVLRAYEYAKENYTEEKYITNTLSLYSNILESMPEQGN